MSNFGAGASKTGDIPNDYQPIASNFQAPAHNLNKDQAAEIIRLAEGSHSHGGQSQSGYPSTAGSSGLTGSGMGAGSSSSGQHLQQARDALAGGGTGSVTQTHTGQSGNYELGQGDLSHNRTSLTGGDSSSYGHGAGAGAAGLGAGGLAATAANQGLGSRDQLSGQSSSPSSSGNNAGQYSTTASIGDSSTRLGNNTNDTAHRSTMDTSSNHGSGPTAASGTIENKLQAELERNAQKKNTHAAGFGTAGMSSDSGKLNHENTGISSTGGQASGGQGQSGYGQTGYTSGATAVGTGAGLSGQHPQTSSIPLHGSSGTGLSSGTGSGSGSGYASGQQQGLSGRLADEVEHRAQGATGSNNVTGLGASGVNAQHGGSVSTSGLGNTGGLGHSTGRPL